MNSTLRQDADANPTSSAIFWQLALLLSVMLLPIFVLMGGWAFP